MAKVTIVGGGIAGIFSALLLKKYYTEVSIVEQESRLGGLLNSEQNENGDWFDFGTHLIAETGLPEIDNILLKKEWRDTWTEFPFDQASNYFNGKLDAGELYIDAKNIGEKYYRGLSEFLELTDSEKDYSNCKDQIYSTLGETFSREIVEPALKKLYGVDDIGDLAVDAHVRFCLNRLRILNENATNAIKKIPCYDQKTSFRGDPLLHTNLRRMYYPKTKGAGCWIEFLTEELIKNEIKIYTGKTVSAVKVIDKKISSIQLSDGEFLDSDLVVWTIPLVFLFKAADLNYQSVKPDIRYTTVYQYTFDKAPLCQERYVICFDPRFSAFRITFYTNIQEVGRGELGEERHRIMVEVLTKEKPDYEANTLKFQQDLIDMGLVQADAKCLIANYVPVPSGFPVLSISLEQEKNKQISLAESQFSNLMLVGKTCTNKWFMHNVFQDIYEKVKKQDKLTLDP